MVHDSELIEDLSVDGYDRIRTTVSLQEKLNVKKIRENETQVEYLVNSDKQSFVTLPETALIYPKSTAHLVNTFELWAPKSCKFIQLHRLNVCHTCARPFHTNSFIYVSLSCSVTMKNALFYSLYLFT